MPNFGGPPTKLFKINIFDQSCTFLWIPKLKLNTFLKWSLTSVGFLFQLTVPISNFPIQRWIMHNLIWPNIRPCYELLSYTSYMLLLLFPLQMIFKQDGLYIGDRIATWMFYVSTYHQSPFNKVLLWLFFFKQYLEYGLVWVVWQFRVHEFLLLFMTNLSIFLVQIKRQNLCAISI